MVFVILKIILLLAIIIVPLFKSSKRAHNVVNKPVKDADLSEYGVNEKGFLEEIKDEGDPPGEVEDQV